jgi:hypothetical protein
LLLNKNGQFLELYKNKIDLDVVGEAEMKTKALLKFHISSKEEEEIDSDLEELMKLYKLDEENMGDE